MNKALILLLVTLVQSQSDGVLLANPDPITSNQFQASQLEDWDSPEPPYPTEDSLSKDFYDLKRQPFGKRSMTSDALTRRSALDKNFMRFGRGGDALQSFCGQVHPSEKPGFIRYNRGLKDNFIRFGRARDNFIRFGRGGGKDGFIRFGRTRPDDFFRAGKSLRENFIRFGKVDKNFMRFGRDSADEGDQEFTFLEEPFQRPGKSSRTQDNFMRFGKSGKNGTNFLRFGKSEGGSGADDSSQDSGLPEVKRKRRDVNEGGKRFEIENKKPTGYFETPPLGVPRILPSLGQARQNLENLKNSRLTPFFPVYFDFPKYFDFYGSEAKRDKGGSNFIRFG